MEFSLRRASTQSINGTAGAVLLAGPAARGGIDGAMPSLIDLVGGEPKMTTDFRQVYAAALEDCLGRAAGSACREVRTAMPVSDLT